jgi:hypothetical protein
MMEEIIGIVTELHDGDDGRLFFNVTTTPSGIIPAPVRTIQLWASAELAPALRQLLYNTRPSPFMYGYIKLLFRYEPEYGELMEAGIYLPQM